MMNHGSPSYINSSDGSSVAAPEDDDVLFVDDQGDGVLFSLVDGGDADDDNADAGRPARDSVVSFASLTEASTVSLDKQFTEFHRDAEQKIQGMLVALRWKTLSLDAMRAAEEVLRTQSPVVWNPYRPPRGAQYRERLEAQQILEWKEYASHELVVVGVAACLPEERRSRRAACRNSDSEDSEDVESANAGVLTSPAEMQWEGVQWFPIPATRIAEGVPPTAVETPSCTTDAQHALELEVRGTGLRKPTNSPLDCKRYRLACALGGYLEEVLAIHHSSNGDGVDADEVEEEEEEEGADDDIVESSAGVDGDHVDDVFAVGRDTVPVDEARRMATGLPPLSPRSARAEEARDERVLQWWRDVVVPELRAVGVRLPPPDDEPQDHGVSVSTAGLGSSDAQESCTHHAVANSGEDEDVGLVVMAPPPAERRPPRAHARRFQLMDDASTPPPPAPVESATTDDKAARPAATTTAESVNQRGGRGRVSTDGVAAGLSMRETARSRRVHDQRRRPPQSSSPPPRRTHSHDDGGGGGGGRGSGRDRNKEETQRPSVGVQKVGGLFWRPSHGKRGDGGDGCTIAEKPYGEQEVCCHHSVAHAPPSSTRWDVHVGRRGVRHEVSDCGGIPAPEEPPRTIERREEEMPDAQRSVLLPSDSDRTVARLLLPTQDDRVEESTSGAVHLPSISGHRRHPPPSSHVSASQKSLQRAQTAYVRPSVKKSVV